MSDAKQVVTRYFQNTTFRTMQGDILGKSLEYRINEWLAANPDYEFVTVLEMKPGTIGQPCVFKLKTTTED